MRREYWLAGWLVVCVIIIIIIAAVNDELTWVECESNYVREFPYTQTHFPIQILRGALCRCTSRGPSTCCGTTSESIGLSQESSAVPIEFCPGKAQAT